jgi:hypothetical protein
MNPDIDQHTCGDIAPSQWLQMFSAGFAVSASGHGFLLQAV